MATQEEQRTSEQQPCFEIECNTISVHGSVAEDEPVPSKFVIQLVPASARRLAAAWAMLQLNANEIATGTTVRTQDIHSDLAGHQVKDPVLLLRLDQEHNIWLELRCFCMESDCYFQGMVSAPDDYLLWVNNHGESINGDYQYLAAI